MKYPLIWSVCGLLAGGAWGWMGRSVPAVKNATAPTGQEAAGGVSANSTASPPEPVSDPKGRERLLLLERIASASGEELMAVSKELFSGETPDYYLTLHLWERWVEVDPEGGFRALMSGKLTAENRMQQAWEYLGKWAVRDPDTAIAKALALPENYDQHVAFSRIAGALATNRPMDFFHRYAELVKMDATSYLIEGAATNLAAADPQALAGLLRNPSADSPLKEVDAGKVWKGLATGWARSDPYTALEFFRNVTDPKVKSEALEQIAAQFIGQDPDLAAKTAGESGGAKSFKKAAEVLARTDPEAALAWLAKHFPNDSKNVASELACQHIPRTAREAVDYMERHAEILFTESNKILVSVSRWSVDDPAATLVLADGIRDPETRSEARSLMLSLLSARSPMEAIEAAAPGAERKRVLPAAVENWAKQDLTAASAWLTSQPADVERDTAISGLLNVALRVEPDSALPWAAAVADSPDRISKLTWVLNRTRKRTGEEVISELKDLGVPSDEITQVLNGIDFERPRP